MRYLITFACYGTHLHGSESGSVDRNHNVLGNRFAPVDERPVSADRERMLQPAYLLDAESRALVLQAYVKYVYTAVGICWRPTSGLTTCM